MKSLYLSDRLLEQYLLFHYGSGHDLMPFSFGPKDSLHFPVNCVRECLELGTLPENASALDLGCAVGRSSFELARHCKKVVGIDNSQLFINTAQQIQYQGAFRYQITEEGTHRADRIAERPADIQFERIEFQCEDAMEYVKKENPFDVVLAANLICRLNNPIEFLNNLSNVVATNGQLIITSPYSWLEEFTPSDYWFHSQKSSLDYIQQILSSSFVLKTFFDVPFLIREHYRKYQWGVSQASVWIKR